jgi:histidyl-tRNA synthetase
MPRRAKNNKDKEISSDKLSRKFSRLRGMKDVLFEEQKYWDLVKRKADDLAATYGFRKIDTPILEPLELFEKSSGKGSDIVTKEMYSFVDKNNERVAIRPEITPGLARAYIEHGMLNLPQPVKMYSFGPVFRHEKPQAGRWRQHSQFDMEMFGETSPVADAQLILIVFNFFKELQMNVQIQINSIGCKACRPEYVNKLTDFYKERGKRAKLCDDCKKRIVKNPLRLLDCKEDKCIEILSDAPQIVDCLCDECRDHFIKVLEYLDELDISYILSPFLVRGLDYYNRTVFEVWPAVSEETGERSDQMSRRQISLGGGGRYDDLIEFLGGRSTPACGFGLGVERTIAKIKELNIPIKSDSENIVYIAQLGENARRKTMTLFEELRRSGFKVRQSFTKDSLKAQLEEADRVGAVLCLILGQKEIMDGTILLRDMESGIQEVVDYKKAGQEIEKKLSNGHNHQPVEEPVNNNEIKPDIGDDI